MDCIKCDITDLCRLRPYAVDVEHKIRDINMLGLPFIITSRCEYYKDMVSKTELQKQLTELQKRLEE